MNWQIFILLFYVANVSRSLIQRRFLRRSKLPEQMSAAVSNLLGVLPISFVFGLLLPHTVNWSWTTVGLLLGEAIFIGLYVIIGFRAIKMLPIAQYQTINQSQTLFVITLGTIVLGERLTLLQGIGCIFILSAAYLIARTVHQHKKRNNEKTTGIWLTVAGAIIMAVGLIFEKAALGHMDTGAYYMYGFTAQTIMVCILAAPYTSRKLINSLTFSDLRNYVAIGFASSLAGMAYLTALSKADNISRIGTLTAFSLPLTALMSYWLLRERDHAKQVFIAVGLGLVGVIITSL